MWFTRIALIAVVAALAFGAGIAVHAWSHDESPAAAVDAATALDGERGARPITLVPADPGTLRREPAAPEPSAAASSPPPVAAAPPVAPPPVAPPPVAPPPASTPEGRAAPPETEARDPGGQPSPGNTPFDSEE